MEEIFGALKTSFSSDFTSVINERKKEIEILRGDLFYLTGKKEITSLSRSLKKEE